MRFFILGLLLAPLGCSPNSPGAAKSPPPSKVEMVPHESDLATITLTKEAAQRLGISVEAAELRAVKRLRTFGGEVIVPSGRSILVSSPVAGIVSTSGYAKFPTLGSKVKAGETVLSLTPILSPERDVPTPAEQVQMAGAKATLVAAQVTALGDVQKGRADVTATSIALDRTKKLLADRAGSQRAVDDAQALANVATTVLAAAEERYAQLTKLISSLDGLHGTELATEIPLKAPVDGVVRSINISAGQQVVSGASLFEVLDTSKVWVRVPIFVDLMSSIQTDAIGKIVSLDGKPKVTDSPNKLPEAVAAIPIEAPPTADPASSSADLYFEIENALANYRPGQRVGVELPLTSQAEATVVPAAAVLYDIYGGTWVYTQKEPLKFIRQRVNVMWFDGPLAMLQNGPATGTMIVADGAAELFGTEFGPGK